MHRKIILITALTTLFFHESTLAAAFQFYELGTPIIGTAGVGEAAIANDASTSYFNPAGMTQFQNSEFMLGSQLILPFTNFEANKHNTIFGNNGGDAATLIPGLGIYEIYNFSPKLKVGISLTAPYGGMLTYNDGWVGRYDVQALQLYTLDLNPVFAYRFTDWLSIGGGFTIEYANLHQTVALPLKPLIDGQANMKVDNTALGFNAGVLLTPREDIKVGVAYRSSITHNLTGETTFLRIPFQPATTTKLVIPQNVIASVEQDIGQLVLLGEVGWANWSTMKNTIVNIAGFTAVTPQDWMNTYRVGVGGQYKLTSAFTVQTGIAYDSSPTTSDHRLPDLPMDRQIRVGTGVLYSVINSVQLGFSYEYINLGSASINNKSSNGVLAGDYARNYANVVQVSVNVEC